MHAFIEYRNEAAHRKVENVLAIDSIGAIARFVIALGSALADLVEEGVLKRRMELNHYSQILKVSEVHYDGYVASGTPTEGFFPRPVHASASATWCRK